MIKGSIQEEEITIINIYAPNVGTPQYVRQMLTSMKGELTITQLTGSALDITDKMDAWPQRGF